MQHPIAASQPCIGPGHVFAYHSPMTVPFPDGERPAWFLVIAKGREGGPHRPDELPTQFRFPGEYTAGVKRGFWEASDTHQSPERSMEKYRSTRSQACTHSYARTIVPQPHGLLRYGAGQRAQSCPISRVRVVRRPATVLSVERNTRNVAVSHKSTLFLYTKG